MSNGNATPIEETAKAIATLHAAHRAEATPLERWIEKTADFVARPGFLLIVSGLVIGWLVMNVVMVIQGKNPVDPYPYSLLQDSLTLLTVYVSLGILTAQRRAAALDELRAQVTLEHTILAEHKAAKIIELLEEMRRDAPQLRNRIDLQAAELAQPTDTKVVVAKIIESHARATAGQE
jgi:uncharacterized membrane protein